MYSSVSDKEWSSTIKLHAYVFFCCCYYYYCCLGKETQHTHRESQVYHSFYPRSLQEDQHDYSSEGNSNIVLPIVS